MWAGPAWAQVAQAKTICAGCPARRQCPAFVLRTHQVHGVWGGLTGQERHPLISATLAGVERGQAAEVGAVHGRRCGSAKLDITSRSQLGRVLPSDAAAVQRGHSINPGQAVTLGLVRRSSPPPS